MQTYVIKATWRSTSKTLLVRARNAELALQKARKLKECADVIDIALVDIRGDDRLRSI